MRRWGFYFGNRLAFAGVACEEDAGTVDLRLVETEHYSQTATLPQRMGMEQRVREIVQSDIERIMGPGSRLSIRFEPHKEDEHLLAQRIFAVAPLATGPDL